MEVDKKEACSRLCNEYLDVSEKLYSELLIKKGKEEANDRIEDFFYILIKELPGFVKHLEIRLNDKENISPLRLLDKFSYLLDEIKD